MLRESSKAATEAGNKEQRGYYQKSVEVIVVRQRALRKKKQGSLTEG